MGAEYAARTEPMPAGEVRVASDAEQEIVDAILAGDHRRALVLCAERHATSLGRLCLALIGSRSEIDDLVQETLLDAHASFGTYRGDGSLRGWLYAIARRKCARHLEKRSRHTQRIKQLDEDAGAALPVEVLIQREQAESARAALSDIRPSEREALVLRFLGELSFAEVGQACGIDEAAARQRVSRGLRRLREILARSGS
ncbi:MAG TPA: RNA polymerase sigma factor [Polyangiaceae bacterium]|nr:RNA polymerase sigma factor [Polyangiaceae bacterium]